jgi:hypothetical protein
MKVCKFSVNSAKAQIKTIKTNKKLNYNKLQNFIL